MVKNWYLLTGVVIVFISAVPLLFLIIKQSQEVQRKSNNTKLRKYVLGLEIAILLCMLPGLPRAFQLLSVDPVNNWSRVASIMNRLPYIFISALLLLIHFYKLKPEDDVE